MHPVNRLLKVFGFRLSRVERSLSRFASSRILKVGGFSIKMPPGSMYHVYANNPLYNSEIGRIAAALYSKYPEMICLDIGANIGDTAAILRGACHAPIICIEGDQSLASLLAENVAQLGNVRLVHSYLGNRREERRVVIDNEGSNSTLVPASNATLGVAVNFSTLDEIIGDRDGESTKLVKIDTEGYEGRIILGARRTLRQGRPAVVFEHNRQAISADRR